MPQPPTAEDVEAAAGRLRTYLAPTPLQPSTALSELAGCEVHLKLETVNPTRTFKVRGALNKILSLEPEERAAGVITASAGNHGQGVAFGAQLLGIPATVYVPEGANPLKVDAMRRLGARVEEAGSNYQEAFDAALDHRSRSGATLVHAYDDAAVIAGQGTVGLELAEQLDRFDTVLVGVGGGGLVGGIATYLKARRPGTRVIGVEPEGADSMARSLARAEIVRLEAVRTIADGLAASAPGELTFEIARRLLDGMIVVEERELVPAIRVYFEREHLLAEPAGAAPLAALLNHHRPGRRERVVLVLSGANVSEEVMLHALRSG